MGFARFRCTGCARRNLLKDRAACGGRTTKNEMERKKRGQAVTETFTAETAELAESH
jgi:hypothetical protein